MECSYRLLLQLQIQFLRSKTQKSFTYQLARTNVTSFVTLIGPNLEKNNQRQINVRQFKSSLFPVNTVSGFLIRIGKVLTGRLSAVIAMKKTPNIIFAR